VEGEVFTRMIACIVLSSEYVLKIANSEDETCHFNIGQARNVCLCFSCTLNINVFGVDLMQFIIY